MEILLGLILAAGTVLVLLAAPIASWVRAARLAADLRQLQARLAELETEVRDLRTRVAAGGVPRVPPPTEERPAHVAPDLPAPGDTGAAPASVGEVVPAHFSSDVASDEQAWQPRVETPPPDIEAARPAGETPPPPIPVAAAVMPEEGWLEAAIGGRLLLYVGTVALVLGVAFFLKYAFDRNWITEWMRVVLGAAGGAALIVSGLRLARSGYGAYGQMLTGGGLGVLYLSVYAAFDFYGLVGRSLAFTLFVGITVLAAVLADRQRSQPMAVMAVGAGFLTPFLVGAGTDAQATLFSYVGLLVGGTMVLAHRRGWPLLNVLSYMLTLLTVSAWASEYYSRFVYLRTELFLTLFCGMFLYIRHEVRRVTAPGAGVALVVLASAPVLYHFASVAILFNRSVALLVYVIAFSLVGAWWSIRMNRPALRLLLWVAAMLPLLGWISEHHRWTWVAPSLVTIGAIFALYLVALFDRLVRHEVALSAFDLVLLHLNGLGAFFAVWVLLEPVALTWVPPIALGLALVHGVVAWQMRPRDEAAALHALAVGFSLVAATIAVQLDGTWLTAAWAAEGAAVMAIGIRVRRGWFRGAGATLFAVAVGRWLGLHLPATPAEFRPILNETFLLGLFVIGLLYLVAWLHTRATPPVAAHTESVAALLVTASILTVLMLTAETTKYWDQRGAELSDATFARGLTISVLWAFYAAVLIVIGIRRRYAPIRFTAIAIFGITIGKVFLVDLSGLEGIYRVVGLMIVGAVLLAVSFLYQRAVTAEPRPGEGRDT
jgi:uncharacterized membrane protein